MKLKHLFLVLLAQMFSMTAFAYDAEIDGIYYNFNGTKATVAYYSNNDSDNVVIPQDVTYNGNTYEVTSIGDYAFKNYSNLTSITIPSTVTVIGDGAFCGSGLTSITIPEGMTRFVGSPFWGCSNLTSVVIPQSMTSISNSAFAYCGNLTSIVVKDGNSVYDSRNGCNAIIETASNILIRGCVNTIIPDNVISIGDYAFSGCRSLTSFIIPETITSIGYCAFANCSDFSTYICNGLSSIVIPASVTNIGKGAFRGCSGLESIIVEKGNPVYDSRDNCNAIIETASNTLLSGCENTIIPENVTCIGDFAFEGCCSLSSIIIPEGVTSIGNDAFGYCYDLTTFNIPESITSLGDYIFNYCNSISVVKIGIKNPLAISYPSNPFSNSSCWYNAKLYVPRGSKALYQDSYYWKTSFKEIVEYNYVYVDDLPIAAGGRAALEIGLNNDPTNLVAFQMDLTLPEGVTLDKAGCSLSSRITDEEQELTIGKLGNGAYRLTSASLSLTPITDTDGPLLTLKLTATEDCMGGQATISNICFSTSESEKVAMNDESFDINVLHKYNLTYKVDGEVYKTEEVVETTPLTLEAEPEKKEGYTFGGWSELPETMPAHDVEVTGRYYLYGDVNTDEEVDVVDVVDVARFVVATPSNSFREKLADLNFDNIVNIADAVTLVNYIAGEQDFVKAIHVAGNYVESSDALSLTRSGKALSMNLTNGRAYTAFQFDLYVSEDAEMEKILLSAGRTQDHQLLYNRIENGHYRVAGLSTSNSTFTGNDGELLSFVMEGGLDTDIAISNIHFFDTKGNDYAFDAIGIDMETGIGSLQDTNLKSQGTIYDLQGRKRSKIQRGVNIVDGKKVLMQQ